jgi:predicted secreted protein
MGLDAIDVTNTDSGENGVCFREQIPGAVILLESATFSFYFDPGDSEHQAVISLMRSRTIMSWRLYDTPNAKSIWQCIGFVANIEFDMEKDAAQTFDVTIEFSLAPTTYGG